MEGGDKLDLHENLNLNWTSFTSTLHFVDDLIYISEVLRKVSDTTIRTNVC